MDKDVLTLPKYMYVIRLIKDVKTLVQIQYKTKITYAHIVKIKQKLVSEGIFNEVKKGRQVTITLTDRGEKLYQAIKGLFEALGIEEEEEENGGEDTRTHEGQIL